jgi:hypothetical protein
MENIWRMENAVVPKGFDLAFSGATHEQMNSCHELQTSISPHSMAVRG